MTTTAGIPTMFQGIRYRSRLEARWAAFFTALGWEFEYEPFDGNGYIPDFLIKGDAPLLVEVKPAVTWADYIEPIPKIVKGLEGVWDQRVWIAGASPLPSLKRYYDGVTPIAGAMLEVWGTPGGKTGWTWGTNPEDTEDVEAYWSGDPRFGIFSQLGGWNRSPSGEIGKPWYDKNYISEQATAHKVQQAWNVATNLVQWRGKNG